MNQTYAIETCDLKKSYFQKDISTWIEVVRGVSLFVKKGEIFGLLGPNGAGKTTCQRMLTTLLPIDSGSAAISGFDIKMQPDKVRRYIGYISQKGGADLPATGRENLMLAGRLYGLRHHEAEHKIAELSKLLELDGLLNRVVRNYSGGQKRRLEIALSIIHQPDVLFMDEPTTGLDPQNRTNLWNHIKNLKEAGMTVFLTTHYLEEADELTDRLAIMDKGQIVASGTPQALKRQISGDVIRIQLKDISVISELPIDHLSFIKEYRKNGNVLYLYVEDGSYVLPMLFDKFKERQILIDTISLSSPTLNDVFLSKTGRSLRDAGMNV